ncbi:MAG TPA: Rieske 2Fe-2S domain-containing protein [Casimicrobiaceae bacterium]|jgi:nitrite reductase/ring-hydroxylating ferredoxin subunit
MNRDHRVEYVEVGALAEVQNAPSASIVAITTGAVAIFNVDGILFGIADACLRCGGSLASGRQHGPSIQCRGCGWSYDLASGRVHGVGLLYADTYFVKVEGGRVSVAALPSLPAAG